MKNNKTKSVEEPVVTSIGLIRKNGAFSIVTIKSQGDKVISREETVEDVWAITWEAFRIKASKEFMP